MLDLKSRALPVLNLLAVCILGVHILVAFLQPDYSFVDDTTYVSAAIHLVLGKTCPAVADNICNYEHPPLAKILMALGFEVFGRTQVVGQAVGVGINQLGGRFFEMVMASVSGPLTFAIVRKLSGNWKMAFVTGLFVLVDPLYFTLSTTAGLDVPMVFFSEAALIPYVYKLRVGPVGPGVLTGVLFGLALLAKETAVFFLLALLSFDLFLGEGSRVARVRSSLMVVLGALVVFCVGLQVFDSVFTQFPNFLDHLWVVVTFHSGTGSGQRDYLTSIANCSLYSGLCPSNASLVPHFLYSRLPLGYVQSTCVACWSATNPLDWITYFPPVAFPTALVLAPNYLLVWMTFAWLPLIFVKLGRRRLDPEVRTLALAGLVFLWNILSSIWLFSDVGRAVFEWYLLPSVPAFAIGGSYLLTRMNLPRVAVYGGVAAVVFMGLLLSPVVYHSLFPQPQICTDC